MAATTAVYRFTGAGPSSASVAAGLKLTRDDANNGTTPVPIPPTGSNATKFSFPAVLALQVTNGTGSLINNIRVYKSGAGVTGMELFHNSEATTPATSNTYTQQNAVVADTATTIATPPTGYVVMTTSTSGTVVDSTGATIGNGASGRASKYFYVVLGVDQTATTTGNVTLPSLNVVYDEQ